MNHRIQHFLIFSESKDLFTSPLTSDLTLDYLYNASIILTNPKNGRIFNDTGFANKFILSTIHWYRQNLKYVTYKGVVFILELEF